MWFCASFNEDSSQSKLEEDKQHSGHFSPSLLTRGAHQTNSGSVSKFSWQCQRKSMPQSGKWGKSNPCSPWSWEAKKSEMDGLQAWEGSLQEASGPALPRAEALPSSFLKKRDFLQRNRPAKAKTRSHKLNSQCLSNMGEQKNQNTNRTEWPKPKLEAFSLCSNTLLREMTADCKEEMISSYKE